MVPLHSALIQKIDWIGMVAFELCRDRLLAALSYRLQCLEAAQSA
jgi:hypothetical protein